MGINFGNFRPASYWGLFWKNSFGNDIGDNASCLSPKHHYSKLVLSNSGCKPAGLLQESLGPFWPEVSRECFPESVRGSYGVSPGPGLRRIPKVSRECSRSSLNTYLRLRGHSWDTFGHSGARAAKGSRDTARNTNPVFRDTLRDSPGAKGPACLQNSEDSHYQIRSQPPAPNVTALGSVLAGKYREMPFFLRECAKKGGGGAGPKSVVKGYQLPKTCCCLFCSFFVLSFVLVLSLSLSLFLSRC